MDHALLGWHIDDEQLRMTWEMTVRQERLLRGIHCVVSVGA